jgi:hypothetical protein
MSNVNLSSILQFADDEPLTADRLHGNTFFVSGDFKGVCTFDPFTHIYMFDCAFPEDLQVHIAQAFNSSTTAQYLVCFTRPLHVIDAFGFKVDLVCQFPTKQCGIHV